MKSGRKPSAQTFENRMSILIYAVHKVELFKVRDIVLSVVSLPTASVRGILVELIELGYLEKVTIYDYRATTFARQLFGVHA